MRHFLTEQQFVTLWSTVVADSYPPQTTIERWLAPEFRLLRQDWWNKHLHKRFGLLYSETSDHQWCVIGPENKINWLLLQL